jgi:glucose/arabinose dehydrogenase
VVRRSVSASGTGRAPSASAGFRRCSTASALPEISAYGVRNVQRFGWDSKGGAIYVSDIGQNTVAEVSPVTAGANLGWNVWEGSDRFGGGRQGVITDLPRNDPKVTYPIVEWDQTRSRPAVQ